MKIEYKKDLMHNYLVISEDKILTDNYSKRMLEHQSINGFLKLQIRIMDDNTYFYYDISSKQTLEILFEKNRFTYTIMKGILVQILHIIEGTYEYLLSVDDFKLEPGFIFLEVNTNIPALCFIPGYGKNLKDQIAILLEYLMNKVDYNDKEAVLLVYRLYAITKEEGYTLVQLMEAIESKEQIKEQIKDTTEENTKSYNEGVMFNTIKSGRIDQRDQREQREQREQTKGTMCEKGEKVEKEKKERNFDASHQIKIDYDIPAMDEKIEGEEECFYYPLKTYILTGVCVLVGIFFMIGCIFSGILYNSFGRRVDTTKLLAALLIILAAESYAMKFVWDKKNKLTKLVLKQEYIDPRNGTTSSRAREESGKGSAKKSKSIHPMNSKLNNKVQINAQGQSQDKKLINKLVDTPNLVAVRTTQQENFIDEENPTCILNDVQQDKIRDEGVNKEQVTFPSLNPMDTNHNLPIRIDTNPFFVGKLRRNVDYCLENEAISRYHAKIVNETNQYYIYDLNSTNGTFVNGEAIMPYQKKEIHYEDEIEFANVKYQFGRS